MFNVAMIGAWHVHAKGYAKELSETENVKVVAVYDENQSLADSWAKELGCEAKSLEAILADETIHGIALCTATNEHTAILVRACEAKKAIFTEKVLTLSNEDALRVAKAVKENGVRFTISFPHKCNPLLRKAKEMVEEGILGDVTYARVRNVHNGSVADWLPAHFYNPVPCGGGAMIDLGAHPMYTLIWFLGKPTHVQSLFTNVTDRPVEDNAVSLLSFPNGAIGVSETGFVSTDNPYTMEVSGTKGSLMIHGDTLRASVEGEWKEITDLPQKIPSPVVQWGMGIDNDAFSIDQAVALTEVMVMAYQSHASH